MPDPTPAALARRFRLDFMPNPWFSLGVHLDHRQWMLQVHLPGVVVSIGWRNRETITRKCPCGRPDSWTWAWRHDHAQAAGQDGKE